MNLLKISLKDLYPTVASFWHPVKNGDLTPDKVAPVSGKKVWWKCPVAEDHEWEARVASRTARQTNCPYKKQHGFKNCKNILPLPFDFVIFHNKKLLIIEYQGQQHYKPVSFGSKNKKETMKRFKQTKLNDEIKRKWCKAKNIPELEIPYWNIGKIESIVKDFLNNH